MAEISITAANVIASASVPSVVKEGTAAAAIVAGEWVYDTATNVFNKAECDGTSAVAAAIGIALNSAGTGQYLRVQYGGDVAVGTVLTAGVRYYLGPTAGKMCLFSDLVSTNRIVELCWAVSTSVLRVDINNTGTVV